MVDLRKETDVAGKEVAAGADFLSEGLHLGVPVFFPSSAAFSMQIGFEKTEVRL